MSSVSSGSMSMRSGGSFVQKDASLGPASLKDCLLSIMTGLISKEYGHKLAITMFIIEFVQYLAFSFQVPGWGSTGEAVRTYIQWTQFSTALIDQGAPAINVIVFAIGAVFISYLLLTGAYSILCFRNHVYPLGPLPTEHFNKFTYFFLGILFIPSFAAVVNGISCNVVETTKECTSAGSLTVIAISVVITVLSIPYAIIASAAYFRPSIKNYGFWGRMDANLKTMEVATKIILVFAYTFSRDSIAFPVLQLICHCSMMLYLAYRLPYFNDRINLFRFAMFGALAWSSFISLIVKIIDNPANGDKLFISWAVILPFIVALDTFLLRRRIQFATTVLHRRIVGMLVQAGVDQIENRGILLDPTLVRAVSDMVSDLKFSSTDAVDIHIRFLQKHQTPIDIVIAYCLLERGLQNFPTRPAMRALMGSFQGAWIKNISAWQHELEVMGTQKLNILHQFMLAQLFDELQALRESIIAGETLSISAALELNHALKQLKRSERAAVNRIKFLWKLLSTGKARSRDVLHVVKVIKGYETEGLEVARTIKKKYPHDHRILSAAARFENNVCYNFKKADDYAARSMKAMRASRKKNSEDNGEDKHDDGDSESASPSIGGGSQRSNVSISQAAKAMFNRNRRETAAQSAYRQSIFSNRPSVSKSSLTTLLLVLLPMVAVSFALAIWLTISIKNIEFSMIRIRLSSERRAYVAGMGSLIRDVQYAIVGGIEHESYGFVGPDNFTLYDLYTSEIQDLLTEFEDISNHLINSDGPGSSTFSSWRNVDMSDFKNIWILDLITKEWSPRNYSTLDATELIITTTKSALQITPEQYRSGEYQSLPQFRLLADMFMTRLSEGFTLPTNLYIEQARNDLDGIINILVAGFAVIVGALAFFGVFVFRPLLKRIVNDVIEYKEKVYQVILSIPKGDCAGLLAKLNAAENENALMDEEEEDEEDTGFDSAGFKGSKGGMESSQMLLFKLTVLFSAGLIMIAGSYAIALGTSYQQAASMKKHAYILKYSTILETRIDRVSGLLRQVVFPDSNTLIDMEGVDPNEEFDTETRTSLYKKSIIHMIEEDMAEFESMKNMVIFGNPDEYVPYSIYTEVIMEEDIHISIPDPDVPDMYLLDDQFSATELMMMFQEDIEDVLHGRNFTFDQGAHAYIRAITIHEELLERLAELTDAKIHAVTIARDEWLGLLYFSIILSLISIYFAYSYVFRRVFSTLQTVLDETTILLQFIPIEYGIQNFQLQVFLRGADDAKLFFEERGWEIPANADELIDGTKSAHDAANKDAKTKSAAGGAGNSKKGEKNTLNKKGSNGKDGKKESLADGEKKKPSKSMVSSGFGDERADIAAAANRRIQQEKDELGVSSSSEESSELSEEEEEIIIVEKGATPLPSGKIVDSRDRLQSSSHSKRNKTDESFESPSQESIDNPFNGQFARRGSFDAERNDIMATASFSDDEAHHADELLIDIEPLGADIEAGKSSSIDSRSKFGKIGLGSLDKIKNPKRD